MPQKQPPARTAVSLAEEVASGESTAGLGKAEVGLARPSLGMAVAQTRTPRPAKISTAKMTARTKSLRKMTARKYTLGSKDWMLRAPRRIREAGRDQSVMICKTEKARIAAASNTPLRKTPTAKLRRRTEKPSATSSRSEEFVRQRR